MISVSDILKILDQIPLWKTVKELPKRMEVLEAENRILQEKVEALLAKPQKQNGQPCAACGEHAVRRISSVKSTGAFGALGVKDEIWECSSCGDRETRLAQ